MTSTPSDHPPDETTPAKKRAPRKAGTTKATRRASKKTSPKTPAMTAEAKAVPPTTGSQIGRIPITKLHPVIEGGAYAAKATLGELIPIRATVFREGHDAVNATAVLTSPSGAVHRLPIAPCEPAGFDRWEARVRLDELGAWTFRIEGWDDPWATWVHNAEIKIAAGIDVQLVCREGELIFTEAAVRAEAAGDPSSSNLLRAAAASLHSPHQAEDRLGLALNDLVRRAMITHGPRVLVTSTAEHPIFCDRRAALFASWYEFFPRSQGAVQNADGSWRSGTFDSSYERLEAAAAMGFDVIYLPPIHPIGTAFRKGPNNTLDPGPNDPGSPWAIGAAEGGHDAIHPDLGDWDSFDRFVAKARELDLEIALDLAFQASPDHPWVADHPEWFSARADGTIAYAENPPKKYQDIYPINFDRARETMYAEALRIVRLWMSHGIRTFRVDNPHTKPIDFWAWLLAEVRRTDPDVLFLAEAFTKPEMMHMLGKVGYQQSYTYFTWRNTAEELTEYLTELSTITDSFIRPNFFVNTPDILPVYLQHGGRSAFAIRAVLGATLSPLWGVYSGYELFENQAVQPGSGEYLDSEKYQYRPRDFAAAEACGESLAPLITRLNEVRRQQPALQQLRDITFHRTTSDDLIAYSKIDGTSRVIIVCSLDPHRVVEGLVQLDLTALGVDARAVLAVRDELSGQEWHWGPHNYVRLSPQTPAHVLVVTAVQ
ncbi:MAG: alpha-1,4-glucan--maltose-1-phosphate maltosyltransferase [Propionibacteriales bacterium]|nr:alpha-1,4-glucan--maltose-1-phosphate maltosyltransferase [Propionibacteriales bacterium]